MLKTRYASLDDLDVVVALFDAYRVHFSYASDVQGAEQFIRERMVQRQSVIVLAENAAGQAVGFAQMYPLFTSLNLRATLLLNDLFVSEQARGLGAGRALLEKAQQHARAIGAMRLNLFTGQSNVNAQAFYESLGFQRDQDNYGYCLTFG